MTRQIASSETGTETESEFCCCWRSACSLSQALIPIIISTIVPVVPKNTSGANDFLFIPTGIAIKAPATENTHVPNALQISKWKTFYFFYSPYWMIL